jgi:hypothetical protein
MQSIGHDPDGSNESRRKTMTKAIVTMMMAAVAMQAETLVTKIEFPFVASGETMPAGKYQVQPVANEKYSIRHEATGKKIVLMGFTSAADRDRTKPEAHLGFACAAGKCVLTQVWAGDRGVENQKVQRELEVGVAPVQVATVAMR